MARMIDCPYCGKLTDPNLGNCPHCGGKLAETTPTPQRLDMGKGRQNCPACKALVQDGDIICVACGTNLLTGQQVVAEADDSAGGFNFEFDARTLAIAAGVAVVMLVFALWMFALTRDPKTHAQTLIADGSYIQAMEVLESYVSTAPDDEDARMTLGRLQYRNNRLASAADSFQHAMRLNRANADAGYFALTAITRRGGDEDYSERAALLERIVDARPDDADAWYLLALTRAAAGDWPGQTEALERYVDAGGDAALRDWNAALAYASEGKPVLAQEQFAKSNAPERRADAAAALGILSSEKRAFAEAQASLEDALDDANLTIEAETLTELGKVYAARGNPARAVAVLDRALRLNGTNQTARYLRALALEAQGRDQQAQQDYESLVSAGRSHAFEAALGAARIQLSRGDRGRASDMLNRASRLGAPDAEFELLSGRVAAANGNDREAERRYGRALAASNNYAPVFLERGLLYLKQDRIDMGLKDLQRYAQLIGNDTSGTKVREVRTLISQLRRMVESSRAARAGASGS